MILIGITGIIGSGKTTVSNILRKKGIEVIDVDVIGKKVTEQEDVKNDIKRIFNSDYVINNKVEVKKIKELVFKDKEKLEELEKIIHPKVREQIYKKIKNLEKKGLRFVIIDAPLLYETGLYKRVNKVVVVSSNEEITTERLKKRGMGEEDIKRRTAIQISLAKKEKMADFVIYNNNTIEELKKEVDKLLERIKAWEEELYASQ